MYNFGSGETDSLEQDVSYKKKLTISAYITNIY